jgi:hypothetical protein
MATNHPQVRCPLCRVHFTQQCVNVSTRWPRAEPHVVRVQLAAQPLPPNYRWMGNAYTTTCDECGSTVQVDKRGVLANHPFRKQGRWCPASHLMDLNPQGSDVHFGATLAGAWEQNRSKH